METKDKQSTISIRDGKFYFRNFAGKKGDYNPEGQRNFGIFLEPEIVDSLVKDGWNVKFKEPRNPDEDRRPYIKVSVSYKFIPPKIVVKTGKKTIKLDEEDIKMLDWADIQEVNVIIAPSIWEVNGKKGIKAYLRACYVTIVEDEFAAEYEDAPDLNSESESA